VAEVLRQDTHDQRYFRNWNQLHLHRLNYSNSDVLASEVRKVVGKLKNNKGVWVDGIPAELIKHGGDVLLERIQ